jgi:RNA polymerase sigma factor, sigma-70 family
VILWLLPADEARSARADQLNDKIVQLMERYGDEILRIAYLYVRDRQRAEDVFQEVFLKAYKSYARFKGDSSEKTWLIRIAINTCKDMLRSPWYRKVIPFRHAPDGRSPDLDPAELIIETEEQRQLFLAVLNLDVVFKDVIILYYYEQLGTAEIARLLGIAEGTVRSRLHRARAQLKLVLTQGGECRGSAT